jgi:hypothetical protein
MTPPAAREGKRTMRLTDTLSASPGEFAANPQLRISDT